VLDYFDDKTHLVHPINSALKSASIRFVMTRAGIAITFHPSHGMFANNDSVEEGVRQFINNFIAYVGNMLHGDVVIIVRGYCGAVIGGYVQFLEEELDAGRIGANRDTWSTRFIHHMRSLSVSLASHYGPDFPPDADRQQAASGFHAELQALKPRFEGLCKVMGVME
jgi:hypothetical protein